MKMQHISLEEIPPFMALAVKPVLENADIELYKNFLDCMYHYTLNSGPRLEYSASEAKDSDLKDLFTELADEEQNHYKLALSDMKSFNLSPSKDSPALVGEFHNGWMDSSDSNFWLGILYSLENVAGFLKEGVATNLSRLNIKPEQATFILEHLVADDHHGDMLSQICEKSNNKSEILKGARFGGQFWIDLHLNLQN